MNKERLTERVLLLNRLGANEERIRQLERIVANQQQKWESDAREWLRLQNHRQELAEWLVDAATDGAKRLVIPLIDARLGGELFVPCSFAASINDKRYRLDLVSTQYEVREVNENG